MSIKFKFNPSTKKTVSILHIFQFVLQIINHHSLGSSDHQQAIEQRICSTEDLLIMTHTNDQHVASTNLLMHQNSERTGQQQQDSNRRLDVATNLLIPRSTERAPEGTLWMDTNDPPEVAAKMLIAQSSERAGDNQHSLV
ncbi:hypothetical protein Hanom_Chr04g00326491 [Helianthus anomalus]